MRIGDRTWAATTGVVVIVLLSGLPGCSRGTSPTLPGAPPAAAATSARSAVPDASANMGIWLEPTKPTGLWAYQQKASCLATDMQPTLGVVRLGGAPSSIQWTIYDTCPGEQVIRIDYKGPTNPFISCPERPEIALHLPFKISYSGKNPAVDVTCTLVPNPCTAFYLDVNKFPDREKDRPRDCPTTSGQIEIEPW